MYTNDNNKFVECVCKSTGNLLQHYNSIYTLYIYIWDTTPQVGIIWRVTPKPLPLDYTGEGTFSEGRGMPLVDRTCFFVFHNFRILHLTKSTNYNIHAFFEALFIKYNISQLNTGLKASKELQLFT